MSHLIKISIGLLLLGCEPADSNRPQNDLMNLAKPATEVYSTIGDIALPSGYTRVSLAAPSFGAWLRTVPLKKTHEVHLYNGQLKNDQSVQFRIIDMPVGTKDLQQCADAIMRLRAEYFYSRNLPDSIIFKAGDGTNLSFAAWLKGTRYILKGNKLVTAVTGTAVSDKRRSFEQYLETVFSYCGTITLQQALKPVTGLAGIMPGDIFVKPGSPGHAMIVTDVAKNATGETIFQLAQSYMPAQDIHIVNNPAGNSSPWFKTTDDPVYIYTPEWTFTVNQLYHW